jgi:UDP-N-acetylmuramoylalanine--D-glutamate ligase
MIPARSFANCDVAVFGLARSGISSIAALTAGGARVVASDDRETGFQAAISAGARVEPFEKWPWDRLKALVLSPGVPLTHPAPHPVVSCAHAAGVPIIGDIELFAREIRPDPAKPGSAPVIAITGTNGKTTTTALVGHILAAAGFAPEIGGNIGKPVLDLAPPNGRTIYVFEVSSYQIDLAPGFVPDIAVLTNITPDHIDRHGSMEGYVAVKARLLDQTDPGGHVVVGVDDVHSAAIHTWFSSRQGAETVAVSVGKVLGRGIFALDGALYDAWGSRASRVMDLATATHLPGAHNWQNAAIAYAVTKPIVKDTRSIVAAIASFPGLAHRIEEVARIGKVRFVNDSKATNADAAERALLCFNDIFWIAGGRPKAGGIESLAPQFGRIRKAYLIGEAAPEFAHTLDGHVPFEISRTLERAVAAAAADARVSQAQAPVVLLSPACASFDQFRDFEQRGDVFREAVRTLGLHPVKEAS